MRLIKFAFLGLVVLFVVLTALSLLLPSTIRIGRVINVPLSRRQEVYAAVSDFGNWKKWNDFVYQSSLTNIRCSSPSGGAGAFLRSDQLRVEEKEADTAGVLLNWDMVNGKQFVGGFQFLLVNPDSLTVQWWFQFHFRWYPWEKLGIFVYDRKLGPVMEESLGALQRFVENPR
ncbi:MAG TPA: SRPBCC family protein [Puia sp.]|nr:SRPBCC family protein [Puia sp.]